MKKILLLCTMLLCFCMSCFANFENWNKSEIPNLLEFKFPTSLEIKKESFDKMQADLASGKNDLRLQLVPNKAMGGKGARINFRVRTGRNNLPAFGKPIIMRPEVLSQWQGNFLLDAAKNLGTQVTLTNPAEIFTFDGKSCIYMEYHYQLQNEPVTYVYVYRFFDVDRDYRVMMHVRSDQYKYWTRSGDDIRDIVKTLVPLE